MGFQQIQAPTLRELFVDQVIGMIFSGELKVGDRLPSERELSEQMHISRSMVHTGLEDLERMGFVRMEARRGNYIEDYARHGNFETLMALGKYGGQFDHAIESSLVEARDAIEGGAMILLGERGTPADIDQLRAIVDDYNVPVMCFGLRTDFQTHLFPGSLRLMEVADTIQEIKTICDCGAKATVNARIDSQGHIVTQGAQVFLGGNDSYIAMCHKCYIRGIRENKIIQLHNH